MIGARATEAVEGFSLVELLLALGCSSLVAAAVLSLLVSSAAAARRRLDALAAQAAVDAAVATVAHDLRRAGTGLEEADSAWLDGRRLPLLSQFSDDDLLLLLAASTPVEVEDQPGGGRFRLPAGHGLRRGDVVAALGQPLRPAGEPLPCGRVALVSGGIGSDTALVTWSSGAAAMLAAWGEPRALVSITLREYEWSELNDGVRLRRRDDSGPWQTVADRLDRLSLTFLLDGDLDGIAASRVGRLPPGSEQRLRVLVVEAGVEPRDGPEVSALEWVRIRRRQ